MHSLSRNRPGFYFTAGCIATILYSCIEEILYYSAKENLEWYIKGLICGLDNLLYMSNCLERKTQVFECSAEALLSEVWKELFLKVYISEKQLTTMQKFSLWYEKHIKVGFIAFESKIYMACLCRRTQSNLTICFSDGWRIWLGSIETLSVPAVLNSVWNEALSGTIVYQKA